MRVLCVGGVDAIDGGGETGGIVEHGGVVARRLGWGHYTIRSARPYNAGAGLDIDGV